MIEERAVRDKLKRWIVEHAKRPALHLTDDTPILDEGLVSSLDVVELVLYIESLRGSEIDATSLDPAVFTSVSAMYRAFFRAT